MVVLLIFQSDPMILPDLPAMDGNALHACMIAPVKVMVVIFFCAEVVVILLG